MKIAQGKLFISVYWGILSSHFFSGPGTASISARARVRGAKIGLLAIKICLQ